MIHKRHITSIAVAVATVLLMAGPAMAVGKFEPLGHYQFLGAANHGAGLGVVTTYGASQLSPTATASQLNPTATLCSEVCGSARAGTYWPDTPPGGVPTASASGPSVVHTTSAGNSFDWGDAAIGAGAAILVMLLLAGGILATNHRLRPGLAKTG